MQGRIGLGEPRIEPFRGQIRDLEGMFRAAGDNALRELGGDGMGQGCGVGMCDNDKRVHADLPYRVSIYE